MKKYPTVNKNGEISEIELPKVEAYISLALEIKIDALEPLKEDANYEYELYQLEHSAFSPEDDKVCGVCIYFSVDFAAEEADRLTGEPREEFLRGCREHFMRKNAPWFFTYGERKIKQ